MTPEPAFPVEPFEAPFIGTGLPSLDNLPPEVRAFCLRAREAGLLAWCGAWTRTCVARSAHVVVPHNVRSQLEWFEDLKDQAMAARFLADQTSRTYESSPMQWSWTTNPERSLGHLYRRTFPELLIGLSVHNPDRVIRILLRLLGLGLRQVPEGITPFPGLRRALLNVETYVDADAGQRTFLQPEILTEIQRLYQDETMFGVAVARFLNVLLNRNEGTFAEAAPLVRDLYLHLYTRLGGGARALAEGIPNGTTYAWLADYVRFTELDDDEPRAGHF